MKISEIQRVASYGGDDWESKDTSKTVSGLKMVPGSDQYGYTFNLYDDVARKYSMTQADMKLRLYDVTAGNLYIGYVEFRKYGQVGPYIALQVSNTLLDSRYRGRGVGAMMYTAALQSGVIIVADETQTPEARKLWMRLNSTPGVEVQGLITIMRSYVDPTTEDSRWFNDLISQHQKLLKKLKAQPLIPIETVGEDDFVPFSFPLRPGAKELAASGLKLYSKDHPEDSEDNYTVTMFARWIG